MNIMRYYKPIVAAFALLLTAFLASAQNNTADVGFTPYSIFGIGDLARTGTTYNKSMGGIGIGDRNERYINILNPAAVTARQGKSFMMDFGLDQNNVYYAANPADGDILHSANNTFTMNHIVMTFPIESHSAFKLGIAPYSNTGYSFKHHENDDAILAEMGDIVYDQIGQGGLSQAFAGAGATLFKRLSIGVDGQYYFGNISRYTSAAFLTGTSYRSINSGWSYVLNGFGAKFGLQYEQPLKNDYKLVLGATYSLGTSLKGEVKRYAYGVLSAVDTIVNNTTALEAVPVPEEIGVGLTFKKNEKWTVGFDYVQQDWTGSFSDDAPGTGFSATKRQAYRTGFEYTPDWYDSRYYRNHITYRAGCYHEQCYYAMNGNKIDAMGITFGASFPVFRYYNSVNVGVDLGQRGSTANGAVRERYFLITVSFALHDIWFLKPMYD